MGKKSHQKRLAAIKSKHFLFARECSCCSFKSKEMWTADRQSYTFGTVHTFYYCRVCCPTKEDVLKKIDANWDDDDCGDVILWNK